MPAPEIRFRPPARVNAGFKGELKVARRLRALGVPVLHGASVGGERERELDLLALIGGRIWVVEVKSSQGHPPRRAADGVRLAGPVVLEKARRQVALQVRALAAALPGAALAGLIVFSERVRVEPPCADAVTLDELPALVARERGDGDPETLAAWARLCAIRDRPAS